MDSSVVPLAPAPPSLGGFLWGFPFFSALEVQRGDHTLQDSQQSVVHHERAPTQELVELFGGTPRAQFRWYAARSTRQRDIV